MMKKFSDPFMTAKGETRASVKLNSLETLWINTGTQCNLACENCYIESSPTNDRLAYISRDDVKSYLDEIADEKMGTKQISLTGGEPFINPSIIGILEEVLSRGHQLLILTNAYRVLKRHMGKLRELNQQYEGQLALRVSLDHYTKDVHEKERGEGTFERTLEQVKELVELGFNVSIAGRSIIDEEQDKTIVGYQDTLSSRGINLTLKMGENIVIFPEMIEKEDVPEITTECWGILDKSPDSMMCATERMVVKRKGESDCTVLPCTLLAYDEQFNLGKTLKEADKSVQLNHEFCAKFCVLGGASCSS